MLLHCLLAAQPCAEKRRSEKTGWLWMLTLQNLSFHVPLTYLIYSIKALMFLPNSLKWVTSSHIVFYVPTEMLRLTAQLKPQDHQ